MSGKGHILLEGGSEFYGGMSEPDLAAISLAGGVDVSISIIPTAAAPDRNDRRAGQNGVRWFNALGASSVNSLPIVDRASAAEPEVTARLKRSHLIYLLGGFPGYLYATLVSSPSWLAVLEAYHTGAVIAGSSAGAMILCEDFFDPESQRVSPGLNLIPGACLLPHHNTFGKTWADRLKAFLPNHKLIGIDEETGIIDDFDNRAWTVYGKGSVTIYKSGKVETYKRLETFRL